MNWLISALTIVASVCGGILVASESTKIRFILVMLLTFVCLFIGHFCTKYESSQPEKASNSVTTEYVQRTFTLRSPTIPVIEFDNE